MPTGRTTNRHITYVPWTIDDRAAWPMLIVGGVLSVSMWTYRTTATPLTIAVLALSMFAALVGLHTVVVDYQLMPSKSRIIGTAVAALTAVVFVAGYVSQHEVAGMPVGGWTSLSEVVEELQQADRDLALAQQVTNAAQEKPAVLRASRSDVAILLDDVSSRVATRSQREVDLVAVDDAVTQALDSSSKALTAAYEAAASDSDADVSAAVAEAQRLVDIARASVASARAAIDAAGGSL